MLEIQRKLESNPTLMQKVQVFLGKDGKPRKRYLVLNMAKENANLDIKEKLTNAISLVENKKYTLLDLYQKVKK